MVASLIQSGARWAVPQRCPYGRSEMTTSTESERSGSAPASLCVCRVKECRNGSAIPSVHIDGCPCGVRLCSGDTRLVVIPGNDAAAPKVVCNLCNGSAKETTHTQRNCPCTAHGVADDVCTGEVRHAAETVRDSVFIRGESVCEVLFCRLHVKLV